MIVSADSRVLTNHGYLRTKDHRLAPLALPAAKGMLDNAIFCKTHQNRELFCYTTDLGFQLITSGLFEIGQRVGLQGRTGQFGTWNDAECATLFGLSAKAIISEKERCILITSEKEKDQIQELIHLKTADNRTIELFIPNEFNIGGSHLFDLVAKYEASPAVLNYCVPEIIFEADYDSTKAYLAAIARSKDVKRLNHNYVQIFSLSNNLFARQVQMLLLNNGIVTKITESNGIAMNLFDFSIFVGKIGIYGNSHDQIDYTFSLFDRATAEPSPSFATIISAKPSEKLSCSQIISDNNIVINGFVINPSNS